MHMSDSIVICSFLDVFFFYQESDQQPALDFVLPLQILFIGPVNGLHAEFSHLILHLIIHPEM